MHFEQTIYANIQMTTKVSIEIIQGVNVCSNTRGYCIEIIAAFDSVEHWAIFKALSYTGINETHYIKILEEIHTYATARIHLDIEVSSEINITRK